MCSQHRIAGLAEPPPAQKKVAMMGGAGVNRCTGQHAPCICECEKSVSSLGRIKTALRSAMCEPHLNGLAMLHVHYHKPLNLDTVIKKFMRRNPRHIVSNQLFSDDDGTSGKPESDNVWLLKTWTEYIFRLSSHLPLAETCILFLGYRRWELKNLPLILHRLLRLISSLRTSVIQCIVTN